MHVTLAPHHRFLRRRVHSLPVLIHPKTLLIIVLLVIKAVIQIYISKILRLASFLCNVIQLVLKNSFDSAENSRFRVKVLVTEIQTFFMHILKNGIYFGCGPFACIADYLSCFEIPFFCFFDSRVTTSKLADFLVLVMAYGH